MSTKTHIEIIFSDAPLRYYPLPDGQKLIIKPYKTLVLYYKTSDHPESFLEPLYRTKDNHLAFNYNGADLLLAYSLPYQTHSKPI